MCVSAWTDTHPSTLESSTQETCHASPISVALAAGRAPSVYPPGLQQAAPATPADHGPPLDEQDAGAGEIRADRLAEPARPDPADDAGRGLDQCADGPGHG